MDAEKVWQLYQRVRQERPLVHCITNVVTVTDCANILLAAGASPTMAHHPMEAAEVTGGCRSLVCNLGATESLEAMVNAGRAAAGIPHPIVLDPVGVSGSGFRRAKCFELLEEFPVTCIRGNLSEIRALMENAGTVAGVDADVRDGVTEENLSRISREIMEFAGERHCMVIASGRIDIVTNGRTVYSVRNGDSMMAQITGSGCMSSALLGAYLGVETSVEAAASACAVMGICGEIAGAKTRAQGGGTMTFHQLLIDACSVLREEDVQKRILVQKEKSAMEDNYGFSIRS